MDVRIFAPEEIIETSVELPLSKSISNRALIMQALTPSAPAEMQVAECDDTRAMRDALRSGLTGEKNVGPAGTAMRFLTAYYAATPGADVTLDGNERMRQRPIGILVEALRQCGAAIEYLGAEGFPPLKIRGRRLTGGTVTVDGSVSSQFLSALLMVAPTMSAPLQIEIAGELRSVSYVTMTVEMMRRRSITVDVDARSITVNPGLYMPSDDDAEPDWSAASYWYEIAAMSAGWVTLPGLREHSVQADSCCREIFEKLGVITAEAEDGDGLELSATPEVFSRLDMDCSDCPDLVQTLCVTCCMLGIPYRLEGVGSLRIKETDRLAALQQELRKLSFDVEIERGDVITWEGRRVPVEAISPIETYGDHRMAMAFAPAGLYISGLKICGAECVSKSYPGFWDDMRRAGFTIEEA